jgi:DNA invertase Pin-like site-specific DNA recombinase
MPTGMLHSSLIAKGRLTKILHSPNSGIWMYASRQAGKLLVFAAAFGSVDRRSMRSSSAVMRNWRRLRASSRRSHRPPGQIQRQGRTQNWIKLGGKLSGDRGIRSGARLTIVRTYRDEGESGLKLRNQAGLLQLLDDVQFDRADFDHILVYDVSRWGRFQDTDESAHYEYICKQVGIKVQYCAEQFENDGSMLSGIVKNLKRVMAAEYSRELSTKVHAGQSRIVSLGFRHGGLLGYGLRRELVDGRQNAEGLLKMGESKIVAN